jgi:uncharacterized membrane protein YgcG
VAVVVGGLDGTTVREARVAEVRFGEHNGFYLINRRIKATFEHPFLVRRDEEWGFCSAELLQVGDFLITLADGQLDEERIDSLERVDGVVRTVAIRVPGTNIYLADGVWTHNDADLAPSSSGPGISASGSGTGPSISVLSSSSSSSSSGSKSSGSSFSGSSTGFSNTGASSSAVK